MTMSTECKIQQAVTCLNAYRTAADASIQRIEVLQMVARLPPALSQELTSLMTVSKTLSADLEHLGRLVTDTVRDISAAMAADRGLRKEEVQNAVQAGLADFISQLTALTSQLDNLGQLQSQVTSSHPCKVLTGMYLEPGVNPAYAEICHYQDPTFAMRVYDNPTHPDDGADFCSGLADGGHTIIWG